MSTVSVPIGEGRTDLFLPVTVPIARQAVLWPWSHKDPADRLLAATAQCEEVELWHTDTVIKKMTGFPHRYFGNVQKR